MNLFKTSIGLTKTIRNVARFREILSVFARHGFDEFIIKSKLDSLIPNFVIPKARLKHDEDLSEYDFWKSVGYRLRKSFEELGPSFIKLGQLLSTREDILNPALIKELKELQDNVRPIEFEIAKAVIEKQLGKNIDEVFESIDPKPIGVASIGIVYKAVLKSGENVVLKVQRPKIKRQILTDFEIIEFIVDKIENIIKEVKFLGVSRAIDDFFKNINLELNFIIEAKNSRKLKENLKRIDKDEILYIPKVYDEYLTPKLLVMEHLEGTPFSDIGSMDELGELKDNLYKAVTYFLHTMLVDGFFHADLHGGNFFHLKNNKIGLIDFGLVGVLSKKNRTNLVAILYAVMSNNYENLVYEFLDVADYEQIPDHEALIRDIKDSLTPFIGLSVQQTDVTAFTHAIVSTLSRHQVYLPREWFIIFRALMTLDGVGKNLNIDLNIFELIDSEIQDVLSDLVSKDVLIEDSIWLGRDLLNSVRVLPRHLRWILKEFARKKYQIDINPVGIKSEINLLARSIYFLGLILLSSTFFLSGALIAKDTTIRVIQDIPILTSVCWVLSLLAIFRASLLYKLK